MKKIVLSLIFLAVQYTLLAQGDNKKEANGGFSLVINSIENTFVVEAGGEGSVNLTDKYFIGGGGYGLTYKKENKEYALGYGGLLLGTNIFKDSCKTLKVSLLTAYGGLTVEDGTSKTKEDLFVLRLMISMDVSLFKWLKISPNLGYRILLSSKENQLSTPFFGMSFRFGN